MPARVQIIERVENNLKALEPCNVEFGVLDVVMIGFNLDVRVESASGFFCDLWRTGERGFQTQRLSGGLVPVLLTS